MTELQGVEYVIVCIAVLASFRVPTTESRSIHRVGMGDPTAQLTCIRSSCARPPSASHALVTCTMKRKIQIITLYIMHMDVNKIFFFVHKFQAPKAPENFFLCIFPHVVLVVWWVGAS